MIQHNQFKRTIIYALLCVYCLGLIKPVVPIVNDVIAHTFYKMQHMATVHFEDGKYHLHAELEEESADMQKESGNIPSSAFEVLLSHLNSGMVEFNSYLSLSQIINSYQAQALPDVPEKNYTPPPRLA